MPGKVKKSPGKNVDGKGKRGVKKSPGKNMDNAPTKGGGKKNPFAK